jgi:malonyl-CoA decarboxylase
VNEDRSSSVRAADADGGTITTISMLTTVARAMLAMRDPASASQLAQVFLARWTSAPDAVRGDFIRFAATELGPPADRLREAAQAYLREASPANEALLFSATISQRQRVLHLLNAERGGMFALIEMRETIQRHAGKDDSKDLLDVVDVELTHLLSSLLSAGSLTFREINWDSPAALVELIIQYESVHEVRNWDDLRRRLQPDRRCYGFFHPLLDDDPVVFVEIALTKGLSSSITDILDAEAGHMGADDADTAVFYSISNCHDGLRGIPFGGLLLKRAIDTFNHEIPQIREFGTLSPIPNFRRWFEREHPKAAAALNADGPEHAAQHRSCLLGQCARYLTSIDGDGRAFDPVGRFHLGNGAEVHRLNWQADPSDKGWRQSYGLMVNYRYEPDQLEANVEALINARSIAASDNVRALANESAQSICETATSKTPGDDPRPKASAPPPRRGRATRNPPGRGIRDRRDG